VNIELKR